MRDKRGRGRDKGVKSYREKEVILCFSFKKREVDSNKERKMGETRRTWERKRWGERE